MLIVFNLRTVFRPYYYECSYNIIVNVLDIFNVVEILNIVVLRSTEILMESTFSLKLYEILIFLFNEKMFLLKEKIIFVH